MNLRLLRNKNLSLLVFGQFVSQIGSGMQQFAFSLYVLAITGSASLFASVLIVSTIPRLLLGPICGVFADWFDRKKIIVYLDLLSGLLMGWLYYVSVTSNLTMPYIYTSVVLLSIMSALFTPAITTAIPSVVDKDQLMEANSFNRLLMTIGFMISPMIGGALFGIYGISVVLLINALSFIFSAISESFIDLKSPKRNREGFSFQGFKKDFNSGVNFIMNHSLIRKVIILSFLANAFFSPAFSIGLIYVANKVIQVSEFQLGLMQSLLMIGSLGGSFLTGFVGKKMGLARIIYLALTAMGILVFLMSLNSLQIYIDLFNTTLIPFLTLTSLAIAVASISVVTNIGMSTLMQKEVPLDILGRVSSVKDTGAMCAVPVGQFFFGIMFDNIPSYIPFMLSGVVMVGAASVFNYFVNRETLKSEVKLNLGGV